MKIKYILWDNDGVLVDTEKWYFKANKITLSEIGIELSKNDYMYYMQNGISVWNIPKEKGINEEIIKTQKEKRNKYYQNFIARENIEIPNVLTVLSELKQNYKMAIITTSKKEDFDLIHRHRNILDHMEFYLTKGDYERSKPHPDPYLSGMTKFNAKPSECIIIEDSARGLKSAIAAGIDCIIIENDFTAGHDFYGAKCIINNIDELPITVEKIILGKQSYNNALQ